MSTPESSILGLVDKIALELVFAEPGKDTGLLPVNSLLSEIESLCPAEPTHLMRQAVTAARHWVDAALDGGGFDAASLQRFGQWSSWMREFCTSSEPPTALPDFLQASAPAAAPPSPGPTAAPTEAEEDEEEEAVPIQVGDNAELMREFTEEAQEHLHRMELDALALEENPSDANTLNSLFRSFHTLKGGAGFINLLPMNRLAHELETLLDLTRQGKLRANAAFIDLILAGRDALRRFVLELERRLKGEAQDELILVPTRPLLKRIQAMQKGGPEAVAAAAEPAGSHGGPVAAGAPVSEAAAPAVEARRAAGFVKVDTTKLDNLIDLVGELVIAQSMVIQDSDMRALQSQHLARNLVHLSRITKDLQHVAMSLRMVPIRATFQKMNRLVRDVAGKAGKLVELRLSGEDTELDRNLIEEISDPLIHMIRNAVDHGIEKPSQREAVGKAAKGIVHLRAFHQGGNVVIEIEDDGAGLNKERILAKAIEVGLATKDSQLTEQEIFGLIFAPGFSTAEKVTEISGRGVGMDVVRRNITKLRGKIEMRSTPGKGSVFSIHLPLTLAIIDGLIFSIGKERFIVPSLCVRESFRPDTEMISTIHGTREMIRVRGQFSPLVRLYERFGIQPETTDPTQSIIVVVESNHQCCGLLVDRLLGKQEVVIKGLGDGLRQNRLLAGAAILGDGRVGLILDINGIVQVNSSHLSDN